MKGRIIDILKESPGLTGKQIAKKIGVAKAELNSFLYNNSDGLMQVEWKWFLADEYVLELSNQSWIDAQAFENDFSAAGCMLNSDANKCVIQFPKNCKLLLVAGARIIALANQASRIGKDVELDFGACAPTRHYLDRLGFFDHLASNISVLPERPENSKAKQYLGNSENLVELASIDVDKFDFDLPEKLTKRFSHHAGQNYYGAAFTIFAELIGNVQEHSETDIPGFVALQLYKGKRPHIQTVISDSGVSISTTLKRNLSEHYPELFGQLDLNSLDSDIYLVSRALTQGGLSQFGSHPNGAARGLGLKKTQKYAAKYDAEVIVRQPEFELKMHYKNGELTGISETKGLMKINGTQVCFDFFLD